MVRRGLLLMVVMIASFLVGCGASSGGNTYAQAATDVLDSMGVNLSNVYTLEGGMQAWGSRR